MKIALLAAVAALSMPGMATAQVIHPQVSPDGTQLAHVRFDAETGVSGLHVLDLSNGQTRALQVAFDRVAHPSWTPDSGRLIFSGRNSGGAETTAIYQLELETGRVSPLVESAHHDGFAHLSPDGRTLVFVRQGETHDLYLLDMESRQISQLTEDGDRDFHPKWSTDGSRILFDRRDGAGVEIVSIDPRSPSDQTVLIRSDAPERRTVMPAGHATGWMHSDNHPDRSYLRIHTADGVTDYAAPDGWAVDATAGWPRRSDIVLTLARGSETVFRVFDPATGEDRFLAD